MSRFLSYCLPLLFALLYHSAFASEGITFSEPHMVDTEVRYSQVGAPNPRALIGDGIIARGQNCNLILSSSTISDGVWSMVTTDFQGNLLDSVPVPLLPGELSTPLTRLFEVYDVIWNDPYFYVIGRPNHDFPGLATYGLCYIRVTEGLQIADDTPVPFMSAVYAHSVMFAANSAHLWAVFENPYHPDSILRFDFDDAMLVPSGSAEIPLGQLAVSAAAIENGVLIVALPDGSRSHVCYSLNLSNELAVLDTITLAPLGRYLPYSYEMLPYGNDSAVACFFDLDESEQPLFRYYVVAADQAAMDGVIHDISIPYLPGDRVQTTASYSINGHELTAISDEQWYDDSDIAIFRFDLTAGTLVSAETVDGVLTPLSNCFSGCSFDDLTALYYYRHYDRLIQLSFELADPTNTVSYKPALYTAEHYRTPTIALDDYGLLIYAQCVDGSGPSLKGFRFADPSQLEVTNSFEILDETYKPHSPDIRIFGDKKILFWLENISEIDPSIYSPFHLQHRFVLMDGDQPSPEELANQGSLFSTIPSSDHISPYCPVLGAAQVGSRIFFDVAFWLSPWEIFDNGSRVVTRSLDLATGDLTPFDWVRKTNGCTGLSSHGDSIITISPWKHCIEYSQAVLCINWETGFTGYTVHNDDTAYAFKTEFTEGSFTNHANAAAMFQLDDETVVSVNTTERLLRLDTEPFALQTITDFSPYFTRQSGYTLTMRPVEPVQTRNYKVAFNFNDDLSYNKVVVFDNDWNFLDSAVIPIAGMLLDVSSSVALPDEDKIIFAYSSYIPYKYASPRLFLQSVNIDIETGVPDNADGALPTSFALHQPYPNPFNPELSLALSIPAKAHLNVEVFNLLGQKVATLHDAQVLAGEMQLDWNASEFSSGVYLIRARYGDNTATVKAILLK